MKKSTRAWLELADRDLKAAIKLAEDEHLANLALFHCQQCIEKCLKAILEEHETKPPQIHSIHRLNEIIQEKIGVSLHLSNEEMDHIDNIYIDTRYPGSLGLLPSGFPTQKQALEVATIAQKAFNTTLKLLKKKQG